MKAYEKKVRGHCGICLSLPDGLLFGFRFPFLKCHFHICVHACCRSVVSDFVIPWTIVRQAALSMEFSKQEYWSGNGTPLRYSCLENPMDGGAWSTAVHGVAKSQTQLSDFTFTFHFHALEKEMATHSSVLAWRIPGTGEPCGLPSMGSHRVGHD